jgi:hypothetical protein
MTAQTILPANSAASGGFDVANSVRMNRGSTDHLRRTNNTGETSNKIGTYSGWLKRSTIALDGMMFEGKDLDANNYTQIYFQATGKLTVYGSGTMDIVSTALFRDPTAWYHVCVAIDTTQGTAANRVKIYVNGVQVTSLTNGNGDGVEYPDQNDVIYFAVNGDQQAIGIREDGALLWNGYFSEVVYIDGTQLTPTSFGEFDEDSGIWKPIKVSGLTFGNNGCYLDFQDSSALGNVVAGRTAVDFTVTNLTAVDQSTDTCTNNFATLNPLMPLGSNITYSDGNLTITPGTSDYKTTASTIAVSSGKWYAEFKAVSGHNGSTDVSIGIVGADTFLASTGSKAMSAYTNAFSYGSGGLVKQYNNSTIRTDATYTNDDIIGIAVDMDNLKLYWSKNGSFQNSGDPTSGASGTGAVAITAGQPYYICATTISSGGVKIFSANFGSPPYSESGGETDGDGYGNFAHAVPSGYFALNTKNLAEYGG